MADEKIDIKKIIRDGTSVASVGELAQKGYTKVRIINEATIIRLIEEAVERIISVKTNLLTEQERDRIIQESRKELDRLVREHQDMKSKMDMAEKDKSMLIKEVENLQQQLKLSQKLAEQEAKRSYEEGVLSQQAKIADMEKQLYLLQEKVREKENEYEKLKADYEAKSKIISEFDSQIKALQAEIALKDKQLNYTTRNLEDLKHELNEEKKEHMRIVKEYQEHLKKVDFEKEMLAQKLIQKEEEIKKLQEEAESDKQQIQELLKLNVTLQLGMEEKFRVLSQEQEIVKQQVSQLYSEDKKADIEKALGKFSEGLVKKLRSLAVLKPSEEEVYKPGEVTIKSLLEKTAEGEVSPMKEEKKEAKDVASAIDKLKALYKKKDK